MARIPKEFSKQEAGVYSYAGYTIRKDGITSQDGTVVATYIVSDMDVEIGSRSSAREALLLIQAIEAGETSA